MPRKPDDAPSPRHAAAILPAVSVDTYNAELRDHEGFIGDRASKRAFRTILDEWRERLRRVGEDPLGDEASEDIRKKRLDEILACGEPEAAALVHSAVEEFARDFAGVIRRFRHLDGWQDTQRIVIGGGFRQGQIGELVIGRTMVLLKADGDPLELVPIRNHPDEAGLIGAVQLAPRETFAGYDGILAIDIGGTNMRAGIVELKLRSKPDFSASRVWKSEIWHHADEEVDRAGAVARLARMLQDLVDRAERKKLRLAPFLGIGCPGLIEEDGQIARGGQNLPGNWENDAFNLPETLGAALPKIDGKRVTVVMHNDAVVQGLSEAPFMRDIERWGVLTIGTGLGNARFTNNQN